MNYISSLFHCICLLLKLYLFMKTRILLTIGDINGIGPEIILKALIAPELSSRYDLTVVSPHRVLDFYSELLKLKIRSRKFKLMEFDVRDVSIQPGAASRVSGFVAGRSVQIAAELCKQGKCDAIVTAPVSKKALNMAGFRYLGHTEMLAHLDRAKQGVMMMIHDKLKIGFASTHPPLKNAAGALNRIVIEEKLRICYDSLKKDFNIKKPRIAVLSLNPHAGESGQIGDEEIKIIKPSINSLKKLKDLKIEGPFPSDSFFANRSYNNYHLTFAMYHDQGMIPFKMIAGPRGVNFTAGLSFIRTSPDHGTAFDIAGENIADEVSLIAAIGTADRIFKNRNRNSR